MGDPTCGVWMSARECGRARNASGHSTDAACDAAQVNRPALRQKGLHAGEPMPEITPEETRCYRRHFPTFPWETRDSRPSVPSALVRDQAATPLAEGGGGALFGRDVLGKDGQRLGHEL